MEKLVHPGTFIKEHVIPSDMSVTDAAKRLGVGRSALSNLLNGNSSLSLSMAVKLEKAFGANRQELLDLQAIFERHSRQEGERSIAVRAYVPSFLTIKALQIENWAKTLDSRHLLPVLLRKLIHSTGHDLSYVDFPGYDNAERTGWDGMVEAGAATPWIPDGKSCWEFGVGKKPQKKANADYRTRTRSTLPAERQECTFVFVTPRNWDNKNEWAKSKNAEGDWNAVRALDASDLEQWLEESIAAQMWFAGKINMQIDKFETLDQFWRRWAEASDPNITPLIFKSSIASYCKKFTAWLEGPCERLFVVTADSKDEALAFLACLFQDRSIAVQTRDLAVVFKSAETLRRLATAASPFIPIVYTEEAERELAPIYRRLRCIVVRTRNAVDSKPDIALGPLGRGSFKETLSAMGIESDRADQLTRESGCSPTILRRRLSTIDAIRVPSWAEDSEVARSLIPMALTGAWHNKSDADREVLSLLANKSYQKVEETVMRLMKFDDRPVWCARQYRGVASKLDALFAISNQVTENDLTNFFQIAECVLSEIDPALDLPDDKRWAAELYGKVRKHSPAIRENICETLVILSVHGNNLFQNRLGINVVEHVSLLIRRLLTPLTLDKLLSHDHDLPHYAEAAPNEFLKLLEADLRKPIPVVLGLLKPAQNSPLGGCPRTGLLWALECLAWKNLGRVSPILAQLSRTVIDDNWVNKPISSLEGIYLSWMPQTAASLRDRMLSLEALTEKFPDICWSICMAQLNTGHHGEYNYRPRWRSDASGAGQPTTRDELVAFKSKVLDLVLTWPKRYGWKELRDLVDKVPVIPDESRTKVWNQVNAWAADPEISDVDKSKLCEEIRQFAFTRFGRKRNLDDATRDQARVACENLQSSDSIVKHAWLFASHRIELSDDNIETKETGHSDSDEEKIRTLRITAMQEIWAEHSFNGVEKFLSNGGSPDVVGSVLALCITDPDIQANFLRQCLCLGGGLEEDSNDCIRGFLWSLDDKRCKGILSAATRGMEIARCIRLLKCAPFRESTWRLLDQYDKEVRDKYWREIAPPWGYYDESELIEIIDRLLEVERPRAAFHVVDLHWSKVETSRLKRLLLATASIYTEPVDHYRIDPYDISKALSSLNGRTGVSRDDMAELEFSYITALEHSEHGIPNLERQISKSPAMLFQAIALTYSRSDHEPDPADMQIENPEKRSYLALSAHRLLDQISHLPGTEEDGKINPEVLFGWIAEVQRLCAEHDRTEIGDEIIGQILSRAPAGEDGIQPNLPVCEVMERIASKHIGIGFKVGIRNQRGACFRGEGGTQERELATKYRDWAKQRAFDYPYISSVLGDIAASYDHDAEFWDAEAEVKDRLRH